MEYSPGHGSEPYLSLNVFLLSAYLLSFIQTSFVKVREDSTLEAIANLKPPTIAIKILKKGSGGHSFTIAQIALTSTQLRASHPTLRLRSFHWENKQLISLLESVETPLAIDAKGRLGHPMQGLLQQILLCPVYQKQWRIELLSQICNSWHSQQETNLVFLQKYESNDA